MNIQAETNTRISGTASLWMAISYAMLRWFFTSKMKFFFVPVKTLTANYVLICKFSTTQLLTKTYYKYSSTAATNWH